MRINNIGPQVVVAPEVRGSVDQVRATQPLSSQVAAAYSGGRVLVEPMELQTAPTVIEERRQAPRRSDDRRRKQAAVLMDTRVSQRRTARRRADDGPPGAIDTQA
jgi:hypothetical protein